MSKQAELKIASKESIAFELAMNIAWKEELHNDVSMYRKKILELYAECLQVTSGFKPEGKKNKMTTDDFSDLRSKDCISHVKVCLDDDQPEYMAGLIRCGSVISCNEDGDEIKNHQELIDNQEFHSEIELKEYIAKALGVDISNVEIMDS